MKTQKLTNPFSKLPRGLFTALALTSSAWVSQATVTSYSTLADAVSANGDTLIAGAGINLVGTDTVYLSPVTVGGMGSTFSLSNGLNVGANATAGEGIITGSPFTFSYIPGPMGTSGNFFFTFDGINNGVLNHYSTSSAATVSQLALIASGMGGFYFELDKPTQGGTASVTDLLLYRSSSLATELNLGNAGADSFSLASTAPGILGVTTGAAYMTSPLLNSGFYLKGILNYSSESGPKSQLRVFVGSTPVPEASALAFGAALVGGLVLVETRRRASKVFSN
jgi:hypothetical protein